MNTWRDYQKYQYNNMHEDVKKVLLLNEWIMWSSRCNCERAGVHYDFGDGYFYSYTHVRFWCVDIICENDLSYYDMPVVNYKNQNSVFKECRNNLDLKAFSEIGTHEFDLSNVNGKVTPVKRLQND